MFRVRECVRSCSKLEELPQSPGSVECNEVVEAKR